MPKDIYCCRTLVLNIETSKKVLPEANIHTKLRDKLWFRAASPAFSGWREFVSNFLNDTQMKIYFLLFQMGVTNR